MGNTLQNSRANKKRKILTIMTALKQVIEAYDARGFKIWHILGDRQFEHVCKHIKKLGIILNVTSCDKHVPEIERFIRMVNERVRAIVNPLPLEQYPNRQIVKTVYNAIFGLNCFPKKTGYILHSACLLNSQIKLY